MCVWSRLSVYAFAQRVALLFSRISRKLGEGFQRNLCVVVLAFNSLGLLQEAGCLIYL